MDNATRIEARRIASGARPPIRVTAARLAAAIDAATDERPLSPLERRRSCDSCGTTGARRQTDRRHLCGRCA